MTRIPSSSLPVSADGRYMTLPFFMSGRPLESGAPVWGMTLRKAGSMRFRWNETNSVRSAVLGAIASSGAAGALVPVPLELIHSKKVYALRSFSDTFGLQGDGMITDVKTLMPVVTVADCMPLFLYDPVTGVFGAVHSGWKGTGIIGEAVRLAASEYGAHPHDICIAIGPHIRSCCYIIDGVRARYFRDAFGSDCVASYVPEDGHDRDCWNTSADSLFRLSLEKANLAVLAQAGVRDENIAVADSCTCCNDMFGSFRRETAGVPESEKWTHFTVQAAFAGYV